jgi:tripartite-type tricarboxylate transporter receptor subunit TctC
MTMRLWVAFSLFLLLSIPEPVQAQGSALADFYRGRTITIVVGYSAGGGYDTYARVLGRHIGKHIPGNPQVVVQNMPGAGSLRAANYIYNVAPKDGTTFGTISRGMAMEPLIGTSQTQYESAKFTWLGSGTEEMSVFATMAASGVKTFQDMLTKTVSVGGEGSGSDPDVYALLLKNTFGAKIRLVSGYPGTAEIALAMERGELDGRASWSWTSIKSQKPDWFAGNKVFFPLQLNLTRNPELPQVPVIMDFAKNDRQKQSLRIVLSRQTMGRPFLAPPGLPEDRKQALRKAFDDTMKDPEFVAEAKARGMEVNPVSGAEIDKLLAELYATPADVVAETKAAISGQ